MTLPQPPVDLKPRRKLFWILLVVLALWVAGLLWMYFATVYPLRHPAHKSAPTAATQP